MDNNIKETLKTVGIITLSVLIAFKIKELWDRARLAPPTKVDA